MLYSICGFTAVYGSSVANRFLANVWNPAAPPDRVELLEIGIYKAQVQGQRFSLIRTTARGTTGNINTPDGDNSWNDSDPPPSGLTLELSNYSVQPTVATPELEGVAMNTGTGASGTGYVWIFGEDGLMIPAGTGVGLRQIDANDAFPGEVYAVWRES